jgi:hypothetical protein
VLAGGDDDPHILWVAIYVDDGVLATDSTALRDRFVNDLSQRFPTEDKGELSWILNVAVTRDRKARHLSLSQELYVSDLLSRYSTFVDPATTRRFDSPMEEGLVLSATDCPEYDSHDWHAMAELRPAYMSITGAILWLANMTYPQLAYPASQLARFLSNPGDSHFRALIRVMLYLRSTKGWKLTLAPCDSMGLQTYVDSNWATRFSCSGALYFYHGCLIHWFSKMQKSVALSSAEAEFFGASLAARDLIFLVELLADLGVTIQLPATVWSDSQSAINLSLDPVAFKKTKHILRFAEFLRDLVARRVITLSHVPGTVMIADILTKAMGRALFVALLALLVEFAASGGRVVMDVPQRVAASGGVRRGFRCRVRRGYHRPSRAA